MLKIHKFSFRSVVTVTPLLGILIAVACGLALVAVAIILVLRLRPGLPPNGGNSRRSNGRQYLATHVHLNHQSACLRDLDEGMDMEEKDPDVIPPNKGKKLFKTLHPYTSLNFFSKELIEEEEAFQNFQERRTRYNSSTLHRNDLKLNNGQIRDDSEKLKGIKNNFSRLVSPSLGPQTGVLGCSRPI